MASTHFANKLIYRTKCIAMQYFPIDSRGEVLGNQRETLKGREGLG